MGSGRTCHIGATIITQWKNYVEGMLIAYLPNERILIEADLFDPPGPGAPPPTAATPANRTLLGHVQRLELDVETIVPIHGPPVAWSEFASIVGSGR